jgi:glutathione S-transferase
MSYILVIGNKRYSSWSLRGWLAARLAAAVSGEAVEEVMVWLDRPETRAQLLSHSPAARVPVLKHQGRTIWDSLAIGLYLERQVPAAGLLPEDPDARAHCLAIVCEMHAGFAALRNNLPMDLVARLPGAGRGAGVAEDIARIQAIWQEARARFGSRGEGPFLFGRPTLADCFYAPVATRFVTYEVPLAPVAAAYRDTIMAWPLLRAWAAPAKDEPELPGH